MLDYEKNENIDYGENIEETFQKGIKILPSLIKAMHLKREKQLKQLTMMQNEYNNQLVNWHKKIVKFERNPKKV